MVVPIRARLVSRMFVPMIIQVIVTDSRIINLLVYCSYKRNNVNILFGHANSTAPFELTRIIVKVNSTSALLIQTPPTGYSSPVREGLVYVSMSPISFKGGYLLQHHLTADTECYDRIDESENQTSLFDHIGTNCLEGRRGILEIETA